MPGDLRVVVGGGGRVGSASARILDDRGHDVVVIERDGDRCNAIADDYVATVIEGDATNPSVLEQVALERTDVVAALTGDAGVNLAICLAAQRLTPDEQPLRTVCRIDDPDADAYRRFVDEVVFPERAGARAAASQIVGAAVQTLSEATGALDILQIRVAEGAPAAGKPLSAVRFPEGALVVSDDDGDRIARPTTTLEVGKHYVVAVESDVADEVMNLLRG